MTTTIPDTHDDYDIARTLQRLADAIIDVGATPTMADIVVQYPHGRTGDVDALAKAIAAPLPQLEQMPGGTWHYTTRPRCEATNVTVFCGADEPAEHKRDRLRRELAELDAQIGAGT